MGDMGNFIWHDVTTKLNLVKHYKVFEQTMCTWNEWKDEEKTATKEPFSFNLRGCGRKFMKSKRMLFVDYSISAN